MAKKKEIEEPVLEGQTAITDEEFSHPVGEITEEPAEVTQEPQEEPSSEDGEIYTVVASRLNVRSGADVNSPVVNTLMKGEKVSIISISNGWGKISENEWIMMQWIKK